MSNSIDFSAPWSTSLKATTIFAMFLTLPLAAMSFLFWDKTPVYGRAFFIGIPLITYLVSLMFAVRGYVLTFDTLLVKRPLWDTRIPLDGLKDAFADPDAVAGSIRLFGIGGLYCYCGIFRNKRFGTYRAYATNFANTVVLSIGSKTVVITPGDPQGFVRAVKERNRS